MVVLGMGLLERVVVKHLVAVTDVPAFCEDRGPFQCHALVVQWRLRILHLNGCVSEACILAVGPSFACLQMKWARLR